MTKIIAGVDEVGRGSLFGNVVAATVVLPKGIVIPHLNDSKKLSACKRLEVALSIKECAVDYTIGQASAEEVDKLNIHYASLLAMQRALEQLKGKVDEVWVDGKYCPKTDLPVKAFVGGDALYPCISAASILAKVTRDQQLIAIDKKHPEYGFAQHKGYPTSKHLQSMMYYGLIKGYRMSYKPVGNLLRRVHSV